MSRYLRYLRIVFSAFCGLACVLVIGLWVRSYWWTYSLHSYEAGADFSFFVENGEFGAAYYRLPIWSHLRLGRQAVTYAREDMPGVAGFYYGRHPADHAYTLLLIPLWFMVLLVATAGILPWIRRRSWRFSLRTLLIATTLVAVLLGLF